MAYLEKLKREDLYFTKSNHWSYEKEWRLLKNIEVAQTRTQNGKISLFNIPTEIIESIYLGGSCSEQLEKEILENVAKHKLNAEVRKMVLNETNFNLDDIQYEEWKELKQNIMNDNLLRALGDLLNYTYPDEKP